MILIDTTNGQLVHFPDALMTMTMINGFAEVREKATGNLINTSKTLVPWVPTAAEELAIAQSSKLMELAQKYTAAISAPVAYMATTFQADDASQTLLAKVLSAGTVPAGFYWLDAANNKVPMTFAQLQGLSLAMLAQGQAAFDKLQTLKAQVRAATLAGNVSLIVW